MKRAYGKKTELGRISGTRVAVLLLFAVALSVNSLATTDALKIKIAKGTYSDETIIRFLPDATTDFDGSYDAWKLFSSNASVPNMFTRLSNGDELTINSIPSFTASVSMEIFLKIGTAATYSISAEEIGAFSSGVDIVMKDLSTNQLYDLRTTNIYLIDLPVISQTASARFLIFFSYPAATAVSNASCSNCADGAIAVTKAGETNWQYTVTDSAGNTLSSGMAPGSTQNIQGLAAGNYTIAIDGNFSCSENKPVAVKVTPLLLGATFIEFTAVCETESVNLSWSTGMESNTDYFTVERSGDGINYAGIANVAAAGTSSALRVYYASDNKPCQTDSYYRIKLTDLNGDISYSKIVMVAGIVKNLFSVFPNPATEILNVVIDENKNSEVIIMIRDLTGREVMILKTIPDSDRVSFAINVPSEWVPGVYLVSAIGAKRTAEQKLLID